MTATEPTALSAEQWAGERGDKWLANVDRLEAMMAPIGAAIIDFAGVKPGERVLDIGCGGGDTTARIARKIAPGGRVKGLDISASLINAAKRRAEREKLDNADFIVADASAVEFESERFDVLFSRFGVMFFNDPVAAFANLRKALAPQGRLAFAAWGPVAENPWSFEVVKCIAGHIDLKRPAPRAPGPFAFGEADYVAEILAGAGFNDIVVEPWRSEVVLGGAEMSAAQAADFILGTMSAAEAVRREPKALQAVIRKDLANRFEAFETPEGVRVGAMAWFVSARA